MVLDARLVELKKKEAQKAEQHQLKWRKKVAQKVWCQNLINMERLENAPACGALIKAFKQNVPNVDMNLLVLKLICLLRKLADKLNGSFLGNAKENFIESFPIPNTKADLLEFLTSMKLHINDGSSLSSAY